MKVIFAELKKIFSLKNILPMLLVFALLFVFFDMYGLTPLETEMSWEYDIVKEYGTRLDKNDVERIKAEYFKKTESQINGLISQSDLLKRIGVENYAEYRDVLYGPLSTRINQPEWVREQLADKTMSDEEFEMEMGMTRELAATPPTADEIAAYKEFFGNPENELNQMVGKLSSFDGQMEHCFDRKQQNLEMLLTSDFNPTSEAGKKRLKEFFETDEYYNVVDDNVTWILQNYSINMFVCTLACIYVFLLPILTRDNMTGILYLQYSSKSGRKILSKQLVSMLIAAAAVCFAICGFGIISVLLEIPEAFHSCGLNGFNGYYDNYWFRGTVLQYVFAVGGLVIAFNLALTLFLFVLSHTSKNYIQLIIKSIPVVAVFGFYAFKYGEKTFMFNTFNTFSELIPVAYAEAYLAAVLLLAGITLSVIFIRKNKARDIL